MSDTHYAALIDRRTEAAYNGVMGEMDAILKRHVSEAVGHSDWPGDVDPAATYAYTEGIRRCVRQLVENGTPEPDTYEITPAHRRGVDAWVDTFGDVERVTIDIADADECGDFGVAMNDPRVCLPVVVASVYIARDDSVEGNRPTHAKAMFDAQGFRCDR